MLRAASLSLCIALVLAAAARADEIALKNGDRITGTLVEITKDELVFKTDYAGDMKIKRDSIASIRTDAPVTVVLADGTRFQRKLEPGDGGTIKFAEVADAPTIGPVTLDKVDAVNPPVKEIKWTGAVAFGAEFNRGNTRNDRIHSLLDAVRRTDADRMTVDAGWNYSRSRAKDSHDDVTNERNVFGAFKYDYFFTEKFFGYGQTRAEGDAFKDLELRYTAGVGVGYQWVEEKDLKFYTEGGVNYFFEDFREEPSDDFISARGAYRLDWLPLEWLTFIHDLEWYPSLENSDDQLVLTDFILRVPIAGKLKGEIAARYAWDNTPAQDSKRLDENYLIGIAYNF